MTTAGQVAVAAGAAEPAIDAERREPPSAVVATEYAAAGGD